MLAHAIGRTRGPCGLILNVIPSQCLLEASMSEFKGGRGSWRTYSRLQDKSKKFKSHIKIKQNMRTIPFTMANINTPVQENFMNPFIASESNMRFSWFKII